jgi:hypothetical protein
LKFSDIMIPSMSYDANKMWQDIKNKLTLSLTFIEIYHFKSAYEVLESI